MSRDWVESPTEETQKQAEVSETQKCSVTEAEAEMSQRERGADAAEKSDSIEMTMGSSCSHREASDNLDESQSQGVLG